MGYFNLFLKKFLKIKPSEDKNYLKALHTESPYGIIFFDAQGKGYSPNATLCDFLKVLPQIPLHLNFLDTFLYNKESWAALSRLKMYSLHTQEGHEVIDLYLRKNKTSLKVSVKLCSAQSVVWFIEFLPQDKTSFQEKYSLSDVLEFLPYPAFIVSAKNYLQYANNSFYKWLNYTPDQIINQPTYRFIEEKFLRNSSENKIVFKDRDGQNQAASLIQVTPLSSEKSICLMVIPQENFISFENDSDKAILENLPLSAVLLDQRGYLKAINSLFQRMVSEKRLLERPFVYWIQEEDKTKFTKFLQQIRRNQEVKQPLLVQFQGKEEKIIAVYAKYLAPLSHTGYFFLLLQETVDLKKIENQTLESQKLQALGQLAGGITHDFNNLLTAMLGFCDLLLQRHTPQDQSFTDIMQIKQNANRATNLVRQLLLFARQSLPEQRPLDIRECLNELSFLLRRLIGTNIELNIKHERDIGLIYGDRGQLEQVMVNLAINARDAMVFGGSLGFRTRTIHLKEPLKIYKDFLKPKIYIVVDVSDTGSGIINDHLDQIFDPFFTTKDPRQGTGLGLSTVYEIMQKMSGGISVESHPNEGTTFSLYFPRYVEKKKKTDVKEEQNKELLSDLTGSAQILLVEDEDPVRLFASRALKSKGYQVFEARDGKKALEILESNSEICLLITDVMMPGIDGPTLVNLAYELNPELKVIFVSGYPEEDVHSQVHFPFASLHFLPKPFNLNELAVKVHQVLEADQAEHNAAKDIK